MSAHSPADRDMHTEIEMLLPWYATGRLEQADKEAVDAHLTQCDACRALLAEEHMLRAAVVAVPFTAPPTPERAPLPPADTSLRHRAGRRWALMRRGFGRPRKPGWFLAAQAATIAAAIGLVQWNAPSSVPSFVLSPETYRTLSAAPTAAAASVAGNIVVVFEPTITEAELRRTLQRVGATIVDGPTSADAYVLHVADARRDAAVEQLRRETAIALAEAIDAGTAP